jgi:HAD superfamily hydrolase (TIGR01509 family)
MTVKPRAVLVDFVSTLFEPVGDHRIAALACEMVGLAVSDTEARKLGEAADRAWRDALVIRSETSIAGYRDAFLHAMVRAGGRVGELAERLHAAEADPRCWRPDPDARAFLERLSRAGVGVAVVSNFGHDIRPIFMHHGLDTFVKAYVVSCEVGWAKPHPAIFREALARLAVDAADAVMVGDDPVNDGRAAAVGIAVRLVEAGRSRSGLLGVLDGLEPRSTSPAVQPA